jgi:hypothetical protein
MDMGCARHGVIEEGMHDEAGLLMYAQRGARGKGA